MRIGTNPQKSEKKIDLTTQHRVIVVVFIPSEDNFYKDSINVFKLCLDSLIASINSKCAITIVNNGSYSKVTDLLNEYLSNNKIDTIIHHKNNVGKIDALIGAARGTREKLITYSDSDILFLNGWQENVEKIFVSFSKVGSVSPIPVTYNKFYGTYSTLIKVATGKLKLKLINIPENYESYNKYLLSINWDILESDSNIWPVIENKKAKAIIGSGHQVLTIDRDILFKTTPTCPSLTLVGGDSEYKYVDEPIDVAGKLRLSTYNNFAYHMGNTVEQWMIDEYNKSLKESKLEPIIYENANRNMFSNSFRFIKLKMKKWLVKKILKKTIFSKNY